MITRITLLCMATIVVISLTNCASIIHGPTQPIDITSQPSGAKITIDGNLHGTTPHAVLLKRKGRMKGESSDKKEYALKIEMDGYFPYEIKLKRELDGWFFGNILFGGIIGIIVDASNGAMYKLNPNQVIAQMGKQTASNNKGDGTLYIAVTLHPDPSWTKIGTLSSIQ